MSDTKIIIAGVLIQFVAIIGSFSFLKIEKSVGTKRSLEIALCIWVFVLIWALLMQTWYEFYMLAVIIGLVLGVSQSAARTLFGLFVPKERAAEFFSFYGIVGKVSAVIGPGIFALVDFLFETRYTAIPLGIMVFLGLLLLFKVDVKKGIEQAGKK
jgi:UMF1 family MFS transporter